MYSINMKYLDIILSKFKWLFIFSLGFTFLFLSCSGPENGTNVKLNESGDISVGEDALPTVIVSATYEIPKDYVDNTGAYIPRNGKPTVVFVDSIW